MTRYLTVVFAIEDEEKFKPLSQQFHNKMLAGKNEPWRVSGMSLGDEMTKVELLEKVVSELNDPYEIKNAVNNIASTPLENLEGKGIADFC